MAYLRFKALEQVSQREPVKVSMPSPKVSDFYGCNVFGLDAMKNTLSSSVFKKLTSAIETGERIDSNTAAA